MKLLALCSGNLNRSAACEIICRAKHPEFEIKSAALSPHARPGRITARKMRDALARAGYGTNPYVRSTNCTYDLITWADLVLYMDESNRQRLALFFSEAPPSKMLMLGDVIKISKIPDPHFDSTGQTHSVVVGMIEAALDNLAKYLEMRQ